MVEAVICEETLSYSGQQYWCTTGMHSHWCLKFADDTIVIGLPGHDVGSQHWLYWQNNQTEYVLCVSRKEVQLATGAVGQFYMATNESQ